MPSLAMLIEKLLTPLQRSKVWPNEDGSPTPAYRLFDLYFATYQAIVFAEGLDDE